MAYISSVVHWDLLVLRGWEVVLVRGVVEVVGEGRLEWVLKVRE
jgi:hypothetical protein